MSALCVMSCTRARSCVCVCVCVCARARARARSHACVRLCVCVWGGVSWCGVVESRRCVERDWGGDDHLRYVYTLLLCTFGLYCIDS